MKLGGTDIGSEIGALFEDVLNPVAPKAQKKVFYRIALPFKWMHCFSLGSYSRGT
jgi:hypothetical protein